MPREFRSFRVEAVVLKHYDMGEADRMLTVYSRQRGKLRALAKGVRKVRSRKAGHVEPFTHVSLQLATGRHWYLVSQAEAIDTYPRLRQELEQVGNASYVVEMLDRFTYEEEESNSLIFQLLTDTLKRLDGGQDTFVAIRYYEMQLLDLLGFRPELHNCVVSKQEIKAEDQYFSSALGGVVSPEAGKGLAGAIPVSIEALRYMRHFQRSTYNDALRAKVPAEVQHEMEVIMQHYITYLLERGMNSPAFLRRVRQEKGKYANGSRGEEKPGDQT